MTSHNTSICISQYGLRSSDGNEERQEMGFGSKSKGYIRVPPLFLINQRAMSMTSSTENLYKPSIRFLFP